MNIQKMRKQNAKNFPDSEKRRFDPLSDTYEKDVHLWLRYFSRRMRAKHGSNYLSIRVFVTPRYDTYHRTLIDLQVELART